MRLQQRELSGLVHFVWPEARTVGSNSMIEALLRPDLLAVKRSWQISLFLEAQLELWVDSRVIFAIQSQYRQRRVISSIASV